MVVLTGDHPVLCAIDRIWKREYSQGVPKNNQKEGFEMKKRVMAMLLCAVLATSLVILPAQAAYTPQYTDEAETLYDLGLFKGTGTKADGTPVFSLENNATRLQALIMLIRLLGQEDEALATTAVNPFTDIDSSSVGAKYAAYAYDTGITKGIGGGKFGNTNVTPAQFLTFVLRALGYDDGAGDFKVATAVQKALEIGLITEELQLSGNTLKRDACAKISYNALGTNLKDTEKVLAEKLVDDGTLTEKTVQLSGVLSGTVSIPYTEYKLNRADIFAAFPDAASVGYSTYFTDNLPEKIKQMDFSLLEILLRTPAIREYCSGVSAKIEVMDKNKSGTIPIYGSWSHFGVVTILDKESHLIGYGLDEPGGAKEGEIVFVTCYLDASEEIEQLKQLTRDVYRRATEVDADAFGQEIFTYESNGIERTAVRLTADRSKLPESVKNFAYYSFCHIKGNNNEQAVRYAWNFNWRHLLAKSEAYSPIQAYGVIELRPELASEDNVLLLYDENRDLLGYALVGGGTLPVTEAGALPN